MARQESREPCLATGFVRRGPACYIEGIKDATMSEQSRATFAWMDLLWLAFLGGLAVLAPIREPHKQLILAAIGLFQIFERHLVAAVGRRGPVYSVVVKILLASWLVQHS